MFFFIVERFEDKNEANEEVNFSRERVELMAKHNYGGKFDYKLMQMETFLLCYAESSNMINDVKATRFLQRGDSSSPCNDAIITLTFADKTVSKL